MIRYQLVYKPGHDTEYDRMAEQLEQLGKTTSDLITDREYEYIKRNTGRRVLRLFKEVKNVK